MFIVIRKSIANKANHRNPRDIRRIGRDQRSERKRIPLPSPLYIWSNEEFSLGTADNLIGIRSGAAVSSNRDSRVHRRFILIYTWSWCRLPRNWIIALRPCTFFMSGNSTRGDSPHPRPRFIVLPRLVICGFRDKAYRRI